MSKTETAAKSKTITFSYRSPTKKVKGETLDRTVPRIIAQDTTLEPEREVDEAKSHIDSIRNGTNEEYVKVDEDFYCKLDKNKYPFSSKYIPMKLKGNDDTEIIPIINNNSLLLHNLQDYKNVNPESEYKWGDESNQIVDSLKIWRKLYKILDNKKRQLKKAQNQKNSSTFEGQLNSSNDSSNGNDDSEDISSDNNNGTHINGSRRNSGSNKRRKLSNGDVEDQDGKANGSDGNGYSSNERKTRSTRSSK